MLGHVHSECVGTNVETHLTGKVKWVFQMTGVGAGRHMTAWGQLLMDFTRETTSLLPDSHRVPQALTPNLSQWLESDETVHERYQTVKLEYNFNG